MMSEAEETVARSVIGQRPREWSAWQDLRDPRRRRIIGLAGYIGLVSVLFVQTLARLLGLALQNDLHSYIPMVPVISAYLLYLRPTTIVPYSSSVGATIGVAGVGFAAIAASIQLQGTLSVNDDLALMMLAYVSLIVAGGFLFLGSKRMAAATFPIAFLLFMIPLPDAAVDWLELALVAASADAAALFFKMTGTPLFREGTILTLPGIVLEVARECSGIRSTVVLFITSVLASHLFLKSTWRRFALLTFVIPLAIVRNGFRILVIGLLCVYIGPHMSESVIHRRGGPVFFVLSLIPLFLFLLLLRRQDRRADIRE
jgi:exosortase C (VPDSG-CTERM-specific)